MGLFSGLFKANQTEAVKIKDSRDAFFAILYAAISADGDVEDAEIDSLAQYLTRSPYFDKFPIVETYRNIAVLKNKIGIEPIVAAALPMVEESKKVSLFAIASDLVLTDGIISPKEESLLEDLQKGLGISDELATKIVEVLLLKNKV